MKSRRLAWSILLGVVAFPLSAQANAGTPLIWVTGFHLLLGNLFLGLAEGALLARLYSLPKRGCALAMVAANYFSAWVGGVLIGGRLVDAVPMDLNNGWRWFWILVVLAYLMTVVIEWPFVALCLRGTRDRFRRSLQASFIIQSASYLVLFGAYWIGSGTSLYTRMTIVSPTELSLPPNVWVYYLALNDGSVHRRRLDGTEDRKLLEVSASNHNDRLLIQSSETGENRCDLVVRVEADDGKFPRYVTVLTNLSSYIAMDGAKEGDVYRTRGTGMNFGVVHGIGGDTNSAWSFRTGFWAVQGLSGSNARTGESLNFSYETLFRQWCIRNAVRLPSDHVLFQLGWDQICLLEPGTRKVALLWPGKGPAPVLETPIIGSRRGVDGRVLPPSQ